MSGIFFYYVDILVCIKSATRNQSRILDLQKNPYFCGFCIQLANISRILLMIILQSAGLEQFILFQFHDFIRAFEFLTQSRTSIIKGSTVQCSLTFISLDMLNQHQDTEQTTSRNPLQILTHSFFKQIFALSCISFNL